MQPGPTDGTIAVDRQHAHADVRAGDRVLGTVAQLDDGEPIMQIEVEDAVRRALVHVDRARVHHVERARLVDRADEDVVVTHDAVLTGRTGTKSDPVRREPTTGPHRGA